MERRRSYQRSSRGRSSASPVGGTWGRGIRCWPLAAMTVSLVTDLWCYFDLLSRRNAIATAMKLLVTATGMGVVGAEAIKGALTR